MLLEGFSPELSADSPSTEGRFTDITVRAGLARAINVSGSTASKKLLLEEYIHNYVVVPYTRTLGRKWAEVTVNRMRQGKPISAADAWIAATALLYNIHLVTHKRKDFEEIEGLTVISEG